MFKNEEGFSLLELVVAVGVAGIIAAVALPTFAGIQDKASQTSATYAASASAAEALANSTIGGVNGTTSNNSSYMGGMSSSAAASSSSANTLPQATMYGVNAGSAALGMNYVTGVSSVAGVTNVEIVSNNPAHNGFKIYAPISSFNVTERNTRQNPMTGDFIQTAPYLSISFNWGSEIHDTNGKSGQSEVFTSLSWFSGFQYNVVSADLIAGNLVITVDVPSI